MLIIQHENKLLLEIAVNAIQNESRIVNGYLHFTLYSPNFDLIT